MRFTLKVTTVVLLAAHVYCAPAGTSPSDSAALITAENVFPVGGQRPSRAALEKCVDAVAEKLGITQDMKTDPAVLQDILKNTMYLDDVPEITKLFEKEFKEPTSLTPLLKAIKDGVTDKHPAVGTVMCAALNDPSTKDLVFGNVNKDVIKRTVHQTYLLEHIVGKLAKDPELLRKLLPIMRSKTEKLTANGKQDAQCGAQSGLLKRMFSAVGAKINYLLGGTDADWCRYSQLYQSAGLFLLVKDISVAMGMEGIQGLRESEDITPERTAAHSRGVSINVAEATMQDFAHGFYDNTAVGYDLAKRGFTTMHVAGTKKKIVEYDYQKDYAPLYESWNLAFITGNMHSLHLLYPKLLIPRVLFSDTKRYIHNRGIALWLTINFFLADEIKRANAGLTEHVKFPGQKELAIIWGKVNSRYLAFLEAKEQAEKEKEAAKEKAEPTTAQR